MKPITKLQSVNESHHQTPICAIIETYHQTSIQPMKPTTKLQSSHQPLPIQPPNNHATHHRLTQTLICAITKTPPQMPITTNPHPPPCRSPQTHALHLTTASRQHPMHRNPQKKKKMLKRETHWFERGAWGIWVWVWVWAKSRDKESSRRLSIKIEGERRKRRRKDRKSVV